MRVAPVRLHAARSVHCVRRSVFVLSLSLSLSLSRAHARAIAAACLYIAVYNAHRRAGPPIYLPRAVRAAAPPARFASSS